jgi:hypothetical protein
MASDAVQALDIVALSLFVVGNCLYHVYVWRNVRSSAPVIMLGVSAASCVQPQAGPYAPGVAATGLDAHAQSPDRCCGVVLLRPPA